MGDEVPEADKSDGREKEGKMVDDDFDVEVVEAIKQGGDVWTPKTK
jgi:hypothetical protein